MLDLWPLMIPALVVVASAIVVVRRMVVDGRDEIIDLTDDVPTVSVEQLAVRRSAAAPSTSGALVDPEGATSLGGRLRTVEVSAGQTEPPAQRPRVAVRRRRRPLTAARADSR